MRKRFLLFCVSLFSLFFLASFFIAVQPTHAANTGEVCSPSNTCTNPLDKCQCPAGAATCRANQTTCTRQAAAKLDYGQTCKDDPDCKGTCDDDRKVCVPTSCASTKCPSGFACKTTTNQRGSTSVCVADENLYTCTCDKPAGVGGKGKNGYTCTKGNDTKKASCKDAEQGCYDKPGETFERDDIFDNGDSGTGVKCEKATTTNIKCTCKTPGVAGSGRNGFSCTKGDETVNKYCKHSEDACNNEATYVQRREDIFDNDPFSGIHCAAPVTPLPPSPPCKEWDSLGRCVTVQASAGINQFSTRPEELITQIFAIILSLAGGIGVLLIMRAGYTIQVSLGNAQKLQEGRDQLIAAIVGLFFLIFSFVFLQAIGVDILRIPSIGSPSGGTGTGTAVGASCATHGDPNSGCTGGLRCDVAQDTSDACRTQKECAGTCQK